MQNYSSHPIKYTLFKHKTTPKKAGLQRIHTTQKLRQYDENDRLTLSGVSHEGVAYLIINENRITSDTIQQYYQSI